MGIDPSTMVSLIDQLEEAGLVAPAASQGSPGAGGCDHPQGRRLLERARQMAAQVQDEVLRGLTAAGVAELLTLLRRALSMAPPQPLWSAEEAIEASLARPTEWHYDISTVIDTALIGSRNAAPSGEPLRGHQLPPLSSHFHIRGSHRLAHFDRSPSPRREDRREPPAPR